MVESKYSILMTVFDRPPEVLLSTLHALSRCDLEGVEVVVVNDGSNMRYEAVRQVFEHRIERAKWLEMAPYEAFRLPDGTNNPARAFNTAAAAAEGANLVLMSSDVLVPPRTFARLRRVDLRETLWTPFVEDTDGNIRGEYCGPRRLFPAPWFLACSREALLAVRGWDESYLGGLCYEDNDVVGRLACHTGRFMGDWECKVFHQGHFQPAYCVEDEVVREANLRNRNLTMEKWKGIPLDAEHSPFDVSRKMHRSGNVYHECSPLAGRLEATIEATTGLLAGVPV